MSDNTSTQTTPATRPQKLHEYQAMLSRRLQEAQKQTGQTGYLGVQIGAQHYLVSLDDAGEILPMHTPTHVPLTQPWYLGVVSVRGQLLGVVDLCLFMGLGATPIDMSSQVMVLSKNPERACGVIVSKLFGLRPASSLTLQIEEEGNTAKSPWVGDAYSSVDGVQWRILNVQALLESADFVQVGR